jgi:hypothetical protein
MTLTEMVSVRFHVATERTGRPSKKRKLVSVILPAVLGIVTFALAWYCRSNTASRPFDAG